MTSLKFANILLSILLISSCYWGSSRCQAQENNSNSNNNTTTITTPAGHSGEPAEIVTSTAAVESLVLTNNADSSLAGRDAAEEKEPSEQEQPEESIEAKSVSSSNEFNSAADDKPAKVIKLNPPEASLDGSTESSLEEESLFEELPNASRPAKSPTSSINMTQIDQIYNEGTRSEQEVVESWLKMGKKIKKTIGGLIGNVVPIALNMTQEAKISNNCSGAMLKWVLSMNHLKLWALKMLDASGKPVAGLLEGSLTMFGNYRQCLNIRAPDDDEIEFAGEFREYFRGKYCVIQAKPWLPKKDRFYGLNSKLKSLMETGEDNPWYERTVFDEVNEWLLAFNYIDIRMDLCIPSLCSREDIQSVVNFLLRGIDFKARVLRCEMDSSNEAYKSSIETGSSKLSDALMAAAVTSNDNFEEKSLSQSMRQLGWVLVPLVLILVVLSATLIIWIMNKHIGVREMEGIDGNSNIYRINKLKHAIMALSLKRSLDSHMNINFDQLADQKPLAIYGIRFLLVMWVISVEFAINFKFEYLRELLPLKDLIFWWPLQIVINSTLQYDSLILLTAFTMSYKLCLEEHNAKIGKSLLRFLVDKYIRLMFPIMMTVALAVLLPLLYRGPVWNDIVTSQSAVCQASGWLDMTFLQNLLPYKDVCLPHTWLLSVELQLMLLMAPIVYYLNRAYHVVNNNRDRLGCNSIKDKSPSNRPFFSLATTPGLLLILCIALGTGYSFYNVYSKDLPPSYLYTMPDPDSKAIYFGDHFMKLTTHIAVFAVGILLGIECRRLNRDTKLKFNVTTHNFIGGFAPKSYHQQQQQHLSASSLPTISNSLNSSSDHNDCNDSSGSSISINITNNKLTSVDEANLKRPTERGISSILWNFLLLVSALAIMASIIFSTHQWSLTELPSPLIAGLYDSISRLLWSLAFALLLYMTCVRNNCNREYSYASRLLGHPLMVRLGKLSLLIYLIHPLVHSTVLAIQEQPIYSSWLMLLHVFVGNMTITIALAMLLSLFLEPYRSFFRLITERSSEFSCA